MESRGISIQTAGMLTAALTVGNMEGSLAGTILIARIGKMKPCLLIFSLIVAVCSAIAWSSQPIGIVIMLGATGFCFGAMMPTFFMAGATMIICVAVILMLPELLKRKES